MSFPFIDGDKICKEATFTFSLVVRSIFFFWYIFSGKWKHATQFWSVIKKKKIVRYIYAYGFNNILSTMHEKNSRKDHMLQ